MVQDFRTGRLYDLVIEEILEYPKPYSLQSTDGHMRLILTSGTLLKPTILESAVHDLVRTAYLLATSPQRDWGQSTD